MSSSSIVTLGESVNTSIWFLGNSMYVHGLVVFEPKLCFKMSSHTILLNKQIVSCCLLPQLLFKTSQCSPQPCYFLWRSPNSNFNQAQPFQAQTRWGGCCPLLRMSLCVYADLLWDKMHRTLWDLFSRGKKRLYLKETSLHGNPKERMILPLLQIKCSFT